MDTKNYRAVETDVLVIGAGAAGFRAALRAREMGVKVALVEKGALGRSGATYFCRGLMAPPPKGQHEKWLKESVENSDYLSNQIWSLKVLEEIEPRIKELVAWGVPFTRDEKGNLKYHQGRGHSVSFGINFDAREMMGTLRNLAKDKGIDLFERVMVADLLTSDGRYPTKGEVVGAVGLHTQSGECLVFKSRGVVIATGPFGTKCKLSTYMDGLTGEGQAMAFRAGAQLGCMEFATHGTFNYVEDKFKFIGQSRFQGMGAIFINRLGEPVMEKYDPVLKERSSFALISQALLKEVIEGRGPIYLDMRHFSKEQISTLWKTYPENMRAFTECGIDISRRPVEIKPVPTLASTGPGAGLLIGLSAETDVARLYAAGNVTKIAEGNPQAYANVSGYRAGESAAKRARESADVSISKAQVQKLMKEIYAPLKNKGLRPDEIFYHINKVVTPVGNFFFKNESRINRVLVEIRRIKEEELPRVFSPEDPHELTKANEARSSILLVELVYLAALDRKESRGPHYREEYPYRDDKNWLKWVVLRNDGRSTLVKEIPVPLETYKFRPEKLEILPNPVQVKLREAPFIPVKISEELCNSCGDCLASCQVDVIRMNGKNKAYPAYPEECYCCGLCERDCPTGAIKVAPGVKIAPELLPY